MRALLVSCCSLLAALPAQQTPAAAPSVPIGTTVDAAFTDLRWQARRLTEVPAANATVVFFATIECPLVRRYMRRVGELAAEYAERGVAVVVMNVGVGDHLVDAAGEVTKAAPAAVFGKDFELAFARACGVDRTATAVVLDRERLIAYRGRIDDQYGYAGAKEQPSRKDLREALDELLAGKTVSVPQTEVSGCAITAPAAAAGGAVPTFARDVAPILQRHCQECHRPGGEAPFPLLEEAHAKKHAAMMAEVAEQGRMPPWYASSAHGTFSNHRGLSAAERSVLSAWANGGMPSGDPAQLPPPKALPTGEWRIGEPDLVIETKAPIRLPADGIVPYKYVVLPHRFTHDTWVEAIEISPVNKRVLHHCNLARVRLGEEFSHEGFITGYVPGGDPLVMDEGTAVRIPAGSALVLEAHYVTTGEPEIDKLRVGLRFPRVSVQKEMHVSIVTNLRFAIPPGATAHPVRAARELPEDAVGIGLFVHMHLRGRDMTVTAKAPDGEEQTLLVVPNYNFDWQQSYRWERGAMKFAKGTKFHALAHYDNSTWNPFNPDASQTVRFGRETTDEMMYLFAFWVAEQEALGLTVDAQNGRAQAPAAR